MDKCIARSCAPEPRAALSNPESSCPFSLLFGHQTTKRLCYQSSLQVSRRPQRGRTYTANVLTRVRRRGNAAPFETTVVRRSATRCTLPATRSYRPADRVPHEASTYPERPCGLSPQIINTANEQLRFRKQTLLRRDVSTQLRRGDTTFACRPLRCYTHITGTPITIPQGEKEGRVVCSIVSTDRHIAPTLDAVPQGKHDVNSYPALTLRNTQRPISIAAATR